jgi:hypothetical protein
MGTEQRRTTKLVITDGGLPGLVAGVIASEETVRGENPDGGAPVLWCPVARGLEAARRHAGALGLGVVDAGASGVDAGGATDSGDRMNRMLLDAAVAALRAACPVVVWPWVPRGPSSDTPAPVEAIGAAVNRAALVSRLVSLDAAEAGIPEVRIETPFVDLSDAQLADLACDVGARFEDCWWWKDDSGAAGLERARWGPLLPVAG